MGLCLQPKALGTLYGVIGERIDRLIQANAKQSVRAQNGITSQQLESLAKIRDVLWFTGQTLESGREAFAEIAQKRRQELIRKLTLPNSPSASAPFQHHIFFTGRYDELKKEQARMAFGNVSSMAIGAMIASALPTYGLGRVMN